MAFDRTNPADLLTLKNEIDNDPQGLGLTAQKQNVVPLFALLHDRALGGGNVTRPAEELDIPDISAVIDPLEYDALAAYDRIWVEMLINQNGSIKLAPFKAKFLQIFSAISATRIAVIALLPIPGSRIEILFGIHTRIDLKDWHAMLKS